MNMLSGKQDVSKFIAGGAAAAAEMTLPPGVKVVMLARTKLRPSETQNRDDFDTEAAKEHIKSMADSMQMRLNDGSLYGVRTPLVVKPAGADDLHEIIAGENRWRAAKLANIEEIPCIIRHGSDEEARLDHNTENSLRRNLTLWQVAKAVQRDAEEMKLSDEKIIISHGLKSKTKLSKLRAVFKLSELGQDLVRAGLINNADYVYELAKLDDKQLRKLEKKLTKAGEGVSVRQALDAINPRKKDEKSMAAAAGPNVETPANEQVTENVSSVAPATQSLVLTLTLEGAHALAEHLGLDIGDAGPDSLRASLLNSIEALTETVLA